MRQDEERRREGGKEGVKGGRTTDMHVCIIRVFFKYIKVLRQIFPWKLKFIAPLIKLICPFK